MYSLSVPEKEKEGGKLHKHSLSGLKSKLCTLFCNWCISRSVSEQNRTGKRECKFLTLHSLSGQKSIVNVHLKQHHTSEPGQLVSKSAGLMIKRLWLRIPAEAVGEFSSPEWTLYADSYLLSVPPPVLLYWHIKDPGYSAKCAGGRLPKQAYTLDPTKLEWTDNAAVWA